MSTLEEMKEMIQAQIGSIGSLEERAAFKGLMEGVFLSLWETNGEMYQKLEARVMDEMDRDISRFRVRVGMADLAGFDPSHHLMALVCEEDAKQQTFTAGELRGILKEQGRVRISTVFVQGSVEELKRFYEQQRSYSGKISAGKDYDTKVFLEPSKRYLDKLEQLYHLFMKNGIPWQTVNAPYFFKMADVWLSRIPDGIPDGQEITGFGMDCGAFNARVRFGVVPIWNIRRRRMESMGFPIPCKDHVGYEHSISIREYGTENAYLVEEKAGIQSVCQRGDKLFITGNIEREKRWDVYIIQSGQDYRIDRYDYPVFGNLRQDGFSERFFRRCSQPVKTKGELERFIRGFGLENYLHYEGCALSNGRNTPLETYSMNFFMRDEIREPGGRKQLVLQFKPLGKERWLLADLASFIASEVQELYPEYLCGGRIV